MPQTSLPSVERSLDQFIERANQELADPVDVSGFDPANREEALRREVDTLKRELADVDTLKRQLADAEARARQQPRPRRGWGGLVTAFVIGGAVVFAASTLMPGRNAPAEPRTVATSPTLTVEPITPPPAEHVAPAPAITVEPITPPPVEQAAPPAAKPAAPVAAAKKHAPVAHPITPQPAGDKKVAGDPGLYNPF